MKTTKVSKKTKPAKPQLSELEDLTKKFEELKTDTAVGTFFGRKISFIGMGKSK